MKKVLWLIVCLMTMIVSLTSCGSTYMATANYDVCYPDGVRSYNDTVYVVANPSYVPSVKCISYGGTNYISVFKYSNMRDRTKDGITFLIKEIDKVAHITSSTAPMRLNNYSIEKVKSKTPKSQWGLW